MIYLNSYQTSYNSTNYHNQNHFIIIIILGRKSTSLERRYRIAAFSDFDNNEQYESTFTVAKNKLIYIAQLFIKIRNTEFRVLSVTVYFEIWKQKLKAGSTCSILVKYIQC